MPAGRASATWLKRLGAAFRHRGLRSGAAGAPAAPVSAARWGDILRVQSLSVDLLTRQATPEELFQQVVEGAAASLGADEASLMLIEGDELRVVSASATEPRAASWRQPVRLGEGVAGLVAQTGTPILLNEGDDLSRFPNFVPKGDRIRSALSVPLEVGGRVVGVLNANRLTGGEPFTQEELAVLRLYGGTAALAIDQANVLRRVQARSRALETLVSVTEAFAISADPADALVLIMPKLGTVVHASQVLALMGEAGSARLQAVAGWTPETGATDAAELAGVVLVVDGEVGSAFQAGQPAWLRGRPVEGILPGWGSLPSRLLLVPGADPRAHSRCALVLGWVQPDFALASEDLRMLEGLARQIELALSRRDTAVAAGALESEMTQARAHLVEVERLATMGQTMAGLVHDINAPLAVVITLAQLIGKQSADATNGARAGQIVDAAHRAQRLVRELLTMARPQPPTFEPVDLHALLQAAMALERPQCVVSGIRLVAQFAAEVPRVTADPHRLGQVFVNLLVNARQAIEAAEQGSMISVRTQCHTRSVEARVIDDGPGIPEGAKSKVFDWFFTTKPPGEGTGLGLAVSREILLTHGGNLRVEDTPGGGATFVLELPVPGVPPAS